MQLRARRVSLHGGEQRALPRFTRNSSPNISPRKLRKLPAPDSERCAQPLPMHDHVPTGRLLRDLTTYIASVLEIAPVGARYDMGSVTFYVSCGFRYAEADDLLMELDAGHVRLVRATWLIEQARAGGILKRRQELPDEAFISPADIRETLKASGDGATRAPPGGASLHVPCVS